MGYIDGLKTATKRIGAILAQLGQPEYPFNLDGLNTALQAVFEGRFKAIGGSGFPSEEEAAKHGFTVEADVIPTLFMAKEIEYPSFFEKGDGDSVGGMVMCGRAVTLEANKGLLDAVYLRDNPHLIPEKFRGEKVIVFTGTRLRGSGGDLFVACLRWCGDAWVLYFHWVGRGFSDDFVLPRGQSPHSPVVMAGVYFYRVSSLSIHPPSITPALANLLASCEYWFASSPFASHKIVTKYLR